MRRDVTGPIIVTSRERAAELMMSTTTRPTIKAVISICDTDGGFAGAGARRPAGLRDIEHRLCLTFDDVTDATSADRFGYIPPERKDIERILAFGRTHDFASFIGSNRLDAAPGRRFLIHCHAGVSRSTATALMLFAQAHGRGYEDASISCLVSACESTPVPNELMIQYADEILEREGKLIRALKNFMLDSYGHKGMYG